MRNIYDMTKEELEEYFIKEEGKKFRATQIYEYLYKKRIDDVDKMTNISKESKQRLKDNFSFYKIKLLVKQED